MLRSKADNMDFIKIAMSSHPAHLTPPPHEKVAKKQERAILPKLKLLVLNLTSIQKIAPEAQQNYKNSPNVAKFETTIWQAIGSGYSSNNFLTRPFL